MNMKADDIAFGREGIFRTTAGPDGTHVEMPYSGIRTFMRRRPTIDMEGVDIGVYGIPFDLTTSGRPGARLGPSALREATCQLAWGAVWPWGFDPFDILSVVDCGDVPFRRGQVSEMRDSAIAMARHITSSGAGTVMLGGDHSTTYTALKAHAEIHGPLALIQFDAHRDTQKSDWFDHGTFVHHAMRDGLIDAEHSVQIGIRTFYDDDDPITVLYRDWMHEHGWRGALARVREIVGGRPAYLTIDIDSLDPAYAPGTGTPVAGGLSSAQLLMILRGLAPIDWRGMDVVEVAPPYDHADVTAIAAAAVVQHYLGIMEPRLVARGRPKVT